MDEQPATHTEDGRYIVVDGRRWRASDPSIPETLRQELVNELMAARRAVKTEGDGARRRVSDAKLALGERGAPWWTTPSAKELDQRIVATAKTLLRHRGDKTICPSDIARIVGGPRWRSLMVAVRSAIARAIGTERFLATQKDATVDIVSGKGPVRITKGALFDPTGQNTS